jgi:hypothetical protein
MLTNGWMVRLSPPRKARVVIFGLLFGILNNGDGASLPVALCESHVCMS